MTNWKRWIMVAALLLLVNAVMIGAYWLPAEFGNYLSGGSISTTAPAQQETIPEADSLEEERAAMQREHRPVVVQYKDSTFEGVNRAGAVGDSRQYYIAVSYVTEDDTADTAPGMKRVTATAALGNLSGPAITIQREALALVDPAGGRYGPVAEEAPDEADLVGKTLESDESIYGFVSFDVPGDFAEGTLEWCLDGPSPCQQVIRAPIP
jgi:hypothetical protein